MLKRLLALDSVAVLRILRESLTGWDALDDDLYASSGRRAPAGGGSRSATQVCFGSL